MKKLVKLLNKPSNEKAIWFMRQAGRYLPEYREIRKNTSSFLDMCYTPHIASEITLQPIRRFDLDAAILFSDILTIPHALGQKLTFEESKGPILEPKTIEEIIYLCEHSKDFHSHLHPVYQAIEYILKDLPDHISLIGFSGAPWTLITYMIEGGTSKRFEKTRQYLYQDYLLFKKAITILSDFIAEYLIKQIESGVDVIQIFDSWSGSIPYPYYQDLAIDPIYSIVRKVREKYQTPIIGFPKGASSYYLDYIHKSHVNCVSLDAHINIDTILSHVSDKMPLQGNIDPCLLLTGGTLLEKYIEDLYNKVSDRPFIFNLGHGIIKETPISHVETYIRKIRSLEHAS